MTFTEYLTAVLKRRREFPGEREGQAYFNCLPAHLAWQVSGSETLDPFHNDANISALLEYAEKYWWSA